MYGPWKSLPGNLLGVLVIGKDELQVIVDVGVFAIDQTQSITVFVCDFGRIRRIYNASGHREIIHQSTQSKWKRKLYIQMGKLN